MNTANRTKAGAESPLRRLAHGAAMLAALGLSVAVTPAAQAGVSELVTNGGFETGDFTGWSVVNTGAGGCGTNAWVVNSTGAHGCSGNVGAMPAPVSGTYAAYSTFDGPASTMHISQQIFVGAVGTASLSFSDTVRMSIGGLARTLSIDLYDVTNSILLANLFSQSFQNVNQGWLAQALDVTGQLQALSGQTVTLRVSNIMPQSFTGPAGFGIDDISLQVSTSVPAPGAFALMALGLAAVGGIARRRRS